MGTLLVYLILVRRIAFVTMLHKASASSVPI
jgi:hypothetical protein